MGLLSIYLLLVILHTFGSLVRDKYGPGLVACFCWSLVAFVRAPMWQGEAGH